MRSDPQEVKMTSRTPPPAASSESEGVVLRPPLAGSRPASGPRRPSARASESPAASARPGTTTERRATSDTPPLPSSVSVSEPAEDEASPGCPNLDAPVRYEVAMPRHLFDRLTDHEDAPRCRYDMATGRAEFVAEPGPAHEGRASQVTRLVVGVEHALDDAGHAPRFYLGRATRLLSDDGAFEPDECLFIDPPNHPDLWEFDGWLDVRKGHPVPDLVVEIDRGARSSHKLAPYFRMGVREAWTFGRRDGARIWVASPAARLGFRAADRSQVLPGLGRGDLDELLAGSSPLVASWRSRQLAKRIARTILARQGRG